MRTTYTWLTIVAFAPLMAPAKARTVGSAREAASADSTRTWALDNTRQLSLFDVSAAAVEYRGRKAVRLVEAATTAGSGYNRTVALVDGGEFHDGTIELWVAAGVIPNFPDTSVRGFAGVAFRSSSDAIRYEDFYLRPTNGRATDQLRRNHAVQYEGIPDYPWNRLRQESPGRYESYVDIEPGVWTKMKVVVAGTHAELFVNDATQPCLIVNDLKLGDTHGSIGLWIGSGTEAYFSQLRVSSKVP